MKPKRIAVFALSIAVCLFGCQSSGSVFVAKAPSPPASASASRSGRSGISSSAPAAAPCQAPPSSAPAAESQKASSLPSRNPPATSCVPESKEAAPSFLNHSVFIGDSVTLKLKNYVTKQRKSDPGFFGSADFLAAGGMGSGNALKPLGKDSIHPYYRGTKALLEDSAAKMGAKKVYLMLGINDIAPYGVEGAAGNLEKLARRFCRRIPGVKIYIQSATPILAEKQKNALNNSNLERYNRLVSHACQKDDWNFLDVASVLRDQTGALKREYCSDPEDLGLHFTDSACRVWIHYILTHTGG